MAFYKNPIIEEPPVCLACGVVVTDGSLICSASCETIMALTRILNAPAMDWEDLGDFIAKQHEPSESDCA